MVWVAGKAVVVVQAWRWLGDAEEARQSLWNTRVMEGKAGCRSMFGWPEKVMRVAGEGCGVALRREEQSRCVAGGRGRLGSQRRWWNGQLGGATRGSTLEEKTIFIAIDVA